MNTIRRFFRLFRDSPTYGRDRANLISGATIGMTALLLNGMLMMLVMPLMLNPDDSFFRTITENVGLGQVLALILLGGATACATLVIPLRLVTVFGGPRTGRYFDQIVLSGITPLRFVIGKATSQNLFLTLILFLLLPWLVLSLSLGGVHPGLFLSGLFLVWLYCMALALVTLWASLYFNELLAALVVTSAAVLMAIFGCIPMPFQPFVFTPFPALIHPVYSSMPSLVGQVSEGYLSVFTSCAICLSAVIGVSVFAIYLGPLYGIIPENSTFGEVIRKGDAKKKRKFRMRLHIQRPSEIAFFYENRSKALSSHEGFIRWGAGFFVLILLASALYSTLARSAVTNPGRGNWWAYEYHTFNLMIHGFGLAIAVCLFSHAKNSTYLQIPFFAGKTAKVSRLDTTAFLFFLLFSTAASIATPFYTEQYFASVAGQTVFPNMYGSDAMNYVRIAVEGNLVISLAGLVIYAFHRLVCLSTWLKSMSLATVGLLYFVVVCLMPIFVMLIFMEMSDLREMQISGMSVSTELAPLAGLVSPFVTIMAMFNETPPRFPDYAPTGPFYVGHGFLLVLAMMGIRRSGRKLREQYPNSAQSEAN
jgi:hypothetical protein